LIVSVFFSSGVMKMKNENIDRNLEDYVNELAVEYYHAKKNKDKPAELRFSSELIRCITKNKDSSPYKKTISKISRYGLLQEKDDIITDALFKSMVKYKPVLTYENGETKEYPFFPYYMSILKYCCIEKCKKDKELYNSISLDYDPSENETGEHNTEAFAELADEDADTIKKLETKNTKEVVRKRLPSVVLSFYIHNKGRSASDIKLSYFRIFVTNDIMDCIIDSNDTAYFNKTEAYECTDKEFVRYISFLKYFSLDELKKLRDAENRKKKSDLFPDEKKDRDMPVSIPCEGRVIAEYRYKANFDEIRTSNPNIQDHKKSYRKALQILFSDLR